MELTIGETDECSLCGGFFKYRKWYSGNDISCKEVNIMTSHPSCRTLINKKRKLEEDTCNVEWEIFLKKLNESKYK